MELNRLKYKYILDDLKKKMVFLVGPRQVGKTWLAKKLMTEYKNPVYLNFDIYEDKEIIKKQQWPKNTDLLIFDELHKMKNWKNYLKGVFDGKDLNLHILVTGSARLEIYRKAGDSLAGRYFIHHLLPITFGEAKEVGNIANNITEKFIERGAFPEPFLTLKDIDAKKWRVQYTDSLLREDVIDFASILDMRAIRNIFERLQRSVGSNISYLNIARDVGISPNTVKRYISLLESLYIIFSIRPYSTKISRSLLKEPKIYFYDTGLVVGDEGSKTENMVAVSLLADLEYKNDILGEQNSLAYMRTKEGKEVDFVLVDSNKEVAEIIEVKNGDTEISKALKYFTEKYGYKGVQLVKDLGKERYDPKTGIKIMKIEKYFLHPLLCL